MKRRVTGAELARRVEKSRNWVSGRTTGAYPITPADAVLICDALGVGLSELMDVPDLAEVRRLAAVFRQAQVLVLDDPLSTSDEKQWLLSNVRWAMNSILSNPDRAARARRKGGR
jgi:transcriptional regulator with XRE-family HTH domain